MSDLRTTPQVPGASGALPPAQNVKIEEKDVLVTPDGQVLDLSITGNLSINVDGASPVKNKSRWQSLKYGFAGLIFVVFREASIKFAAVITALTIAASVALHLEPMGWALMFLALGQVWITESLNTAIEAAIDLGTDKPHPLAKIGKDVGSGASVISTAVYIAVALAVLGPKVLLLGRHWFGHA